MSEKHIGKVIQVIGPVLDIQFKDGELPERLCAENLTGLNLAPKLRQSSNGLGRGALYTRRNSSASGCGVYRSENAGMSSANAVRICMAESLRFLEEGSSAPG